MTDEEFERWKKENGWYFTWGDLALIIAFILFMFVAVHFS